MSERDEATSAQLREDEIYAIKWKQEPVGHQEILGIEIGRICQTALISNMENCSTIDRSKEVIDLKK